MIIYVTAERRGGIGQAIGMISVNPAQNGTIFLPISARKLIFEPAFVGYLCQ